MTIQQFIDSTVDGQFVFSNFWLLRTKVSLGINTLVYVFWWISVLELLGHRPGLCLSLGKIL